VIRFSRAGGMRLPQFHEVLEIDKAGTYRMWRSVSKASALPAPIGRFAGRVAEAQLDALGEAAARAAGVGSGAWLVRPDSPVDTIDVDGAEATLGIHDEGDGAWETLVGLVRPLLKELTASPEAAIALDVDGGATLVHLGTQPLPVDLSTVELRAVHWRDDEALAEWSATISEPDEVAARPGWRLALPFQHGFDLEADDRLTVGVTFAVHDGDRLVPVGLQTP